MPESFDEAAAIMCARCRRRLWPLRTFDSTDPRYTRFEHYLPGAPWISFACDAEPIRRAQLVAWAADDANDRWREGTRT